MKQEDDEGLEQAEDMLRDKDYGEDPEQYRVDAISAGRSGETISDVTRLGDNFE